MDIAIRWEPEKIEILTFDSRNELYCCKWETKRRAHGDGGCVLTCLDIIFHIFCCCFSPSPANALSAISNRFVRRVSVLYMRSILNGNISCDCMQLNTRCSYYFRFFFAAWLVDAHLSYSFSIQFQ